MRFTPDPAMAIQLTSAVRVKNDTTWPFDTEQYLLLNFAIESVIDPSFEEDILEVDYVRIYDKIGTLTWSDEFN